MLTYLVISAFAVISLVDGAPLSEQAVGNNIAAPNDLYAAAAKCDANSVKTFIGKGQDVNVESSLKLRPICLCPQNDVIMQLLLDNGATVTGDCGYFPLPIYMMQRTGRERISTQTMQRLIAKGLNVNFVSTTGVTPLQEAAATQTPEMVNFLISNGAKIKPDNNGWTPTLRAGLDQVDARNGSAIIDALQKVGGSFSVQTRDNSNFLILVCEFGKNMLPYVKMALERGRIDVNSNNQGGKTPLLSAIDNSYANANDKYETVKYLLSKGARVDVKDSYGNTPDLGKVSAERQPTHAVAKSDIKGRRLNYSLP